jgi:hypothetical protein
MFAMQVVKGMSDSKQAATSNKIAKSNAALQTLTSERNAQLANIQTQNNNTIAAANGALNRFRQSIGNQQVLKNAAQYNEALAKNLTRLQDQAQTGDINTRIQAAEHTGQLVASAHAAGVGGSTVDQIGQVIRSQTARALQASERNQKLGASDVMERIRQVNSAAILGMDTTTYTDRVTQVAQVSQEYNPQGLKEVPSFAQNAGMAALSTLGSKAGMDAAGSFFSAPSTGANMGVQTQVEGFNPAPATTNPQFFNVASMFGGST